MSKRKIIVAIDGYSSTGKSTVAKELAKKTGYIYVDTGAMYRAVTLYAMQKGFIDEVSFDEERLIDSLNKIKLKFKFNPDLGFSEIYLNGNCVEQEIRSLEVSKLVSLVSEVSEVRRQLVAQQQEAGKNKGVIMDGRDIGTVVFPNAELKIFMTALPEIRAKRRYDELCRHGVQTSYSEVLKNVHYRDHVDSTRSDSPLMKAPEAVVFDNSNIGPDEQLKRLYALIEKEISRPDLSQTEKTAKEGP